MGFGIWLVELLKREAHYKTVSSLGGTKLQVLNLGIGGDSSTKILKRMPGEIASRYSAGWEFVFIFSFGTNDERSIDGEPETSIEQFEANIRAVIDEARIHTSKILFVGTPPIGQPVTMLKGQEYSDERVKAYEERLVNILQTENIPFVLIRPIFEQSSNLISLYSYDQLHPGDEGHKLIATAVLPELNKLLGSSEIL